MKRLSIRLRVTLWYTLFMVVIVALTFAILYHGGRRMIRDHYRNALQSTAALAENDLHRENGMLEIDRNLEPVGDVRVSLYDGNGMLLYGRTRFDLPFEDGTIRTAEGYSGESWYVCDFRLDPDGEGTVWLRCHILSTAAGILNTVGEEMWILFAVVVLSAAIGGYLITRRAFRPVKEIANTAESIADGKDLKNRIELHDTQDELYAIASVFNEMLDRLESSFETERRFTSDASHELRTPVSAILLQSEFALSDLAEEQDRIEALEDIHARAGQMSDLIGKLLSMARMDDGRVPLHTEVVDLRDLCDAVLVQLREAAGRKNVTLRAGSESVTVRCDRTMLQQALMNLAENAVKYGREGGEVRLDACSAREGACIRVSDDGPGIRQEDLPRIFDRFFQCDLSHHTTGSGLGLTLVKRIIELHGGSIHVESTPGMGSTFTLFIPQKEGEN